MKKKLIGYVSVDSGQVMIIDPCYLSNYEDNNFVYKTGVRKGKKEYYCWQEIDGKKIRWGNQTDSGQNKLTPSDNRAELRSKTYPGIAKAMARQWTI